MTLLLIAAGVIIVATVAAGIMIFFYGLLGLLVAKLFDVD